MNQGARQAEEAAVERHYIHYRQPVSGTHYGGEQYVAALQRLRASAAVAAARKVEPFFWHDAPKGACGEHSTPAGRFRFRGLRCV